MAENFGHVSAGQPFRPSARFHNATADVINAFSAGALSLPGPARPKGLLPGEILIRNDSGLDVPRFGILGLDGMLIEPGDEPADDEETSAETRKFLESGWAMKGVLPVITIDSGRFAVAQEPIKSEKIGRALIHGTTPVRVLNSQALRKYGYADIDPGGGAAALLRLRSGPSGAPILWEQHTADPAEPHWALIMLGQNYPCTCVAKLTDDLPEGGEAPANVMLWGRLDSSWEETEDEIVVNSTAGIAVDEGRQVFCAWIDGTWHAIYEFHVGPCGNLRTPDKLEGYEEGKAQALISDGAGCWGLMGIKDCNAPEEDG